MSIQRIFVVIGLIVATLLGIYGQDISYYLHEQFPIIPLRLPITITTFLSIGLYIMIPILLFKSEKGKKGFFIVGFIASILVGLPISMFSFFVWAMWMG